MTPIEKSRRLKAFAASVLCSVARSISEAELEAIALLYNVDYKLMNKALHAITREEAAKILKVSVNEILEELARMQKKLSRY